MAYNLLKSVDSYCCSIVRVTDTVFALVSSIYCQGQRCKKNVAVQ